MGIGSTIKRAARRAGGAVSRTWDQVEGQAARAEQGKLFGSNVYSRYAANITGATTSAKLVRRARNNEMIEPNNVVDDARVMRPTQGYSNAQAGVVKDEITIPERERQAEFARNQAAQEMADRNAQGVLIRRRRNRADPTKGGTLLTGALGLAGNAGTKLGVV